MAAEGEESSEPVGDGDEPDEVPTPVKPTSLKNFVKTKKDMRAGGDAIDLFQSHLEIIIERMWLEASKHAEDEGRKTVKEDDIQHAINQLTEPHDLIKSTADKLHWMKKDLDRQVEQSIMYAENRYDD